MHTHAQMVMVYHVPSGATLRQLPQEGRVRCVALTRKGDVLVSSGLIGPNEPR